LSKQNPKRLKTICPLNYVLKCPVYIHCIFQIRYRHDTLHHLLTNLTWFFSLNRLDGIIKFNLKSHVKIICSIWKKSLYEINKNMLYFVCSIWVYEKYAPRVFDYIANCFRKKPTRFVYCILYCKPNKQILFLTHPLWLLKGSIAVEQYNFQYIFFSLFNLKASSKTPTHGYIVYMVIFYYIKFLQDVLQIIDQIFKFLKLYNESNLISLWWDHLSTILDQI
jgi:hypothetical protein